MSFSYKRSSTLIFDCCESLVRFTSPVVFRTLADDLISEGAGETEAGDSETVEFPEEAVSAGLFPAILIMPVPKASPVIVIPKTIHVFINTV